MSDAHQSTESIASTDNDSMNGDFELRLHEEDEVEMMQPTSSQEQTMTDLAASSQQQNDDLMDDEWNDNSAAWSDEEDQEEGAGASPSDPQSTEEKASSKSSASTKANTPHSSTNTQHKRLQSQSTSQLHKSSQLGTLVENQLDDEEDQTTSDAMLAPLPLQRNSSYVILNSGTLAQQLAHLVQQTAEVLFVTPSEAAALLKAYGWKRHSLQAEWFESQQAVRDKVGLTPSELQLAQKHIRTAPDGTQTVQCQSAYCDEVPISQAFALNCGHWFCADCWTAFLTSQIRHGAQCVTTTCPGMSCTNDKPNHTHKFGCSCREVVDESLFSRFVSSDAYASLDDAATPKNSSNSSAHSDSMMSTSTSSTSLSAQVRPPETLLSKYRYWLLCSFVEGQRFINWCPRPGCEHAVHYASGGAKTIQCACGHAWCFSCQRLAHQPSPCDLAKRWLEREQSEDATQIWLQAKTKECPKSVARLSLRFEIRVLIVAPVFITC